MTRRYARAAGFAFSSAIVFACAGDPDERGSTAAATLGTGIDSAGDTGLGEGSEGDASSSASGPAADDGGTKFDMAVPDAGMPPVTGGCDKVDFLFVIDGSVSMANEQAALATSFPGFIDAIGDTLTATSDYHIMVVDTDAAGRCTKDACEDPTPSSKTIECCLEDGAGAHACNTNLSACDETLGAGVVHPAGTASSNVKCDLAGGNRYVTEDQPDIAAAFDCVAHVGIAGDPSERPMDAMLAAVSADLNAPGACNEGFLRDDAILVVTFISDDPYTEDSGDPQGWHDALVAAKGGNAAAIVVLGVIPGGTCHTDPNPDAGDHWAQFVALWGDHGASASVCEADYAPFFTAAVDIVDDACDEFEPPG
jgi:hypothetical protein